MVEQSIWMQKSAADPNHSSWYVERFRTLARDVGGRITVEQVADDLSATARPFWMVVSLCGMAIAVLAYLATGAWAERTAVRTRDRVESRSGSWTA